MKNKVLSCNSNGAFSRATNNLSASIYHMSSNSNLQPGKSGSAHNNNNNNNKSRTARRSATTAASVQTAMAIADDRDGSSRARAETDAALLEQKLYGGKLVHDVADYPRDDDKTRFTFTQITNDDAEFLPPRPLTNDRDTLVHRLKELRAH